MLLALDAVPAIVIGRSYGGETAAELALRYPDRVRALVLLEAAALTIDDEAMTWAEGLRAAIKAAATRDVSAVAETFLRRVLGNAQWESFPDPIRQMFVDNSPAIVAEFRGPWFEGTTADLARIDVPRSWRLRDRRPRSVASPNV